MANQITDVMLQRAYDAHLSGQSIISTGEFGLCGAELQWLVNAGYVEITKQWATAAEFKITNVGINFKSRSNK